MKIIAYILAGLFIVMGALFVIASFGAAWTPSWFFIGTLLIVIGLVLVWFGTRQKTAGSGENVTLKIDLPSNTTLDKFQCQNCGGALTTENVKMVAGAPVVSCPYCNTSYQLSEEPKW